MNSQLVGIKFTEEEHKQLKQYVRDKAAKEKKDITLSSLIRDIIKKELDLECWK